MRDRLSEIHDLIHSIQMGVRAEDGSKQQRYQIPRALPAAFQHLVLLLVVIGSISNWSEYSRNQMRSAFDDCEGLLVEGRKQLLLMIHTDDYRDSSGFQAVDAEALLSLILANLISSMSTNDDFHLTEVYAEYTTKIQGIVRDSASVKVGQLQLLLAKSTHSPHLGLRRHQIAPRRIGHNQKHPNRAGHHPTRIQIHHSPHLRRRLPLRLHPRPHPRIHLPTHRRLQRTPRPSRNRPFPSRAIHLFKSRIQQQSHHRIHSRHHHFPTAIVRDELSRYEHE